MERPAEPGTSRVAQLELLKQRAAERIDEAAERLGALSRAIWSAPELAYEEHSAHCELTRFLEREPPAASWAVQPHFGLATAFRAEWATPEAAAGPGALQLAFLCEYDALPALGHACGHNLIAEVGVAAALGLRAALEGVAAPPPVKVSNAGPQRCLPAVHTQPGGPDQLFWVADSCSLLSCAISGRNKFCRLKDFDLSNWYRKFQSFRTTRLPNLCKE